MKKLLKLRINGEDVELYVEPSKTLRDVIHDELELTGTKTGCSSGRCGACTIIIDGKAVKSCLILASQAKGREILTIEGLGKDGLHPLQQAFIDHFAVQCGFCTPGIILAAKALLDENPNASYEEVREGLKGNLCRCTGYVKIMDAVMAAKEQITA